MVRKGGLLGLVSIRFQREILNPFGWGFLTMGVFLLLVVANIIPFTPRFDFFEDPRNIFWTSFVFMLLGVILNEQIKKIFQR